MIRRLFALVVLGAAPVVSAQSGRGEPAVAVSAPITDIVYRVTVDRALAARRTIHVDMSFRTGGKAPVRLALPAWTPGAYEISYFARWMTGFSAVGDGRPLVWDKTDYDSWVIAPAGATQLTVSFDYRADSLDNAMAWTKPDFALFNGTNLFLYPEGRGFDFPATVRVATDSTWRVVTGMAPTANANTYAATNYHDLVDMPFFVGRVGIDSVRAGDGWVRLAWYPMNSVPVAERSRALAAFARLIPVEGAVFGETPFKTYTVMQIADSSYTGLSGLEHQNSHVDVVTPLAMGDPVLYSIYAHEIFHAWNVKRLRPAELWPYQYAHEQPTPWLWVSEGITDYYADLSELRAGLIDSAGFFELTSGKMMHVAGTRPISLNDASLSAWIHPLDGTEDIYYDKGSLAGLMLDILIRDGSGGTRTLDDVMRQLYRESYQKGAGFAGTQWWSAVTAAAGGRSFADFSARYVEGREPYPWAEVLPLAGLRLSADTIRTPSLGIQFDQDSSGAIFVRNVQLGSPAQEAGVRVGDVVLALGEFKATDRGFLARVRLRYRTDGEPITVTVRRAGGPVVLNTRIHLEERVMLSIASDPAAGPKAAAIRSALLGR